VSTAAEHARAQATLEGGERAAPHKVLAIRVLNYLTNHVVARFPSFALRRSWYSRVLGATIGRGSGIHLGCYLWFYSPGQVRRGGLVIGEHSRVNRDCTLDVRGGVRIGDNVSISPEVMILTAAHGVEDPEFRVETRPVVLEDHVYVGSRAIVMPGVTLGRGSVVAAGAIVTRDVPPLAIAAGIPARVVGQRSDTATNYVLDAPFPLFE
jgi:acetyltransferase-like isoleucine patch superfamily enzyme